MSANIKAKQTASHGFLAIARLSCLLVLSPMPMTLCYYPLCSVNAIRVMLAEYDRFGCQYRIVLDLMQKNLNVCRLYRPDFCINGQSIELRR